MKNSFFYSVACLILFVVSTACTSMEVKDLTYKSVEAVNAQKAEDLTPKLRDQLKGEKLLKVYFHSAFGLNVESPEKLKLRTFFCENENEKTFLIPLGGEDNPKGYYPSPSGKTYHFYVRSSYEVKKEQSDLKSHDLEKASSDICFSLIKSSNVAKVPSSEVINALKK